MPGLSSPGGGLRPSSLCTMRHLADDAHSRRADRSALLCLLACSRSIWYSTRWRHGHGCPLRHSKTGAMPAGQRASLCPALPWLVRDSSRQPKTRAGTGGSQASARQRKATAPQLCTDCARHSLLSITEIFRFLLILPCSPPLLASHSLQTAQHRTSLAIY